MVENPYWQTLKNNTSCMSTKGYTFLLGQYYKIILYKYQKMPK